MAGKLTNWDDYEYGRFSPRQGSVGSTGSRVRFEEHSSPAETERLLSLCRGNEEDTSHHGLRQRRQVSRECNARPPLSRLSIYADPFRSSLSMRLNSMAQAGGPNSLENFARSWQRAAGFHEITPVRSSFVLTEDSNPPDDLRRIPDEERSPQEHRSLLRQQLEQYGSTPEIAVHDGSTEAVNIPNREASPARLLSGSPAQRIFQHASRFGSPFAGTYGSLSSRTNEDAREQATQLYDERLMASEQDPDKKPEALLIRRIEQRDGEVTLRVVGQSTIYQTILNCTNVLVGVGLLSLPFGIKYSGWLLGILFLTISAAVTRYTASLLGKCLDSQPNAISFSDLAGVCFGNKGQIAVGALFTLELTATCVALFVLFADCLNLLIPKIGLNEWKILCGIVMLPLTFVPFRLLAYTSFLGVISCFFSEYLQLHGFPS